MYNNNVLTEKEKEDLLILTMHEVVTGLEQKAEGYYDPTVIAIFVDPADRQWCVIEYNGRNFFGHVSPVPHWWNDENEWGYFDMCDLERAGAKRVSSFEPTPLSWFII